MISFHPCRHLDKKLQPCGKSWSTLTSESFWWNWCVSVLSQGAHLLWDCHEKAQSSSMHHHCRRLMSQRRRQREGENRRTVYHPEFRSMDHVIYVSLDVVHIAYYMAYTVSHSFQFLLWAIRAIFHMAEEQLFYQGGSRGSKAQSLRVVGSDEQQYPLII